MFANFTATKPG